MKVAREEFRVTRSPKKTLQNNSDCSNYTCIKDIQSLWTVISKPATGK
jgi:hypothetical protein